MSMTFTRLCTAVFSVALLTSQAFASTSGVTYQGRILKPDGSPLSGQFTQFKMQIRTPDAQNCLMYEELQSQDLRNSNGTFSLTINDQTGSRTDTTGLTLDRIFANRGTFTLDPLLCSSGAGSYAPNASDGRNLVVLFKDETMASWEPIPAQKINFVPFAFEAKQVQGFTADSLLRVVNGSGDPLTGLAPLSNAQYTELLALANGTSSSFSKLGGVALPTMTSGEVLGWNGSAWVSQPAVAGPNSVSTTMIQNSAVDSTKIASGAVGTTQVASNVTINTSGTLGAAVTTTRDFKIFAASPSLFSIDMQAPALTASYSLVWPLNDGNTGEVLTTDGSGVLSWAPAAAASQWTTQAPGINYMAGSVGIGTTSPTALFHVVQSSANPAGNQYLAKIIESPTYSASASASATALNVGTAVDVAAGQTLTGSSQGVLISGTAQGGGTATSVSGLAVNYGVRLTQTASISNAYGINVIPNHAGGTITNSYGVYIGSPVTGGAVSNEYGFYQASASARNYFAGNVGIGTTSPTDNLTISAADSATKLRVLNTNSTAARVPGLTLQNYSGGFGGYPALSLVNGGGSQASTAATASGDVLGRIQFRGTDAAGTQVSGSYMTSTAAESFTSSASGSNLQFWTTPVTTNVPVARVTITNGGNVGFGLTSPTAAVHLRAGSANASTAPLKFTSGTLLAIPEDGALEYDGAGLWYTIGSTRYVIPTNSAAGNYSNVSNISNTGGAITMTPAAGNSVIVNQSTVSTSSTTGALIVNGGVGVAGALNAGGNITSGGSITATTNAVIPQLYGSTAAAGDIRIDGSSNATKGNVYLASAGGAVGIGTTSVTSMLEVVRPSTSATSGTFDGAMVNTGLNPTSPSTALTRAVGGTASHGGSANSPNAAITGVAGAALNTWTGTLGNATGINGFVASLNGGTINDARGGVFQVENTASTINKAYGIWIDNVVGTQAWSLYSNNSQPSYFRGAVGIGTTSPSGIFEVNGGTAAVSTNGLGINLKAQNAGTGNQNGGDISLSPGAGSGTGYGGSIYAYGSIYMNGLNKLVGFASTIQSSNSTSMVLNAATIGNFPAVGSEFVANESKVTFFSTGTGTGSKLIASKNTAVMMGQGYDVVIGGKFEAQNTSLFSGSVGIAKAGEFSVSRTQPIDNGYGVYIGTVDATNKFSLYANDATAPSYFAGNVGIGTTAPQAKLQVAGQIVAGVKNNAAATAFDFANGNTQYTSTACSGGAAWALSNMIDGGQYTIVVKNTTHTGACTFSHTGISNWYFRPSNGTPGAGHVTYTMMRVGSDVYISWIDGFQ